MPSQRFSRKVPYLLSAKQQTSFLALIDEDEDLRADIETIVGVDLSKMKKQERIAALRTFIDAGQGAALVAQVGGAFEDLHAQASRIRGEATKDEVIASLTAENAELRTSVESLREEFNSRLDTLTAQPVG